MKPPYILFVMGANRWRDEEEWAAGPYAIYRSYTWQARATRIRWTGDGELLWKLERRNRKPRRVSLTIRAIRFRPWAARVCCDPKIFPWGPMDQRSVEKRNDVLVYTSQTLKRGNGSDWAD